MLLKKFATGQLTTQYKGFRRVEFSNWWKNRAFFFLSGSTKKANNIKLRNDPNLSKIILLDLIWIKTSKKKCFIKFWKKLMLVPLVRTLKKKLLTLRELLIAKKLRPITEPCLWFFCKHKFRETKVLVNVTDFKIILSNGKELKID